MVVVPDGQAWAKIYEADLLAATPGAAGPVLTTTPPGRGDLLDLADHHVYTPSPDFFSSGTDSFHYEAQAEGGGTIWGTAFLVAGMRGDEAFSMPVDDPLEIDLVTLSPGEGSIAVNGVDPIRGPYDLLFELALDTATYLTFTRFGGEPGDGPTGGTLGSGLDGGGGWWQNNSQLVIASAGGSEGQELARSTLIGGSAGLEIAGSVWTSTGYAKTSPAAIAFGETWELQWWAATASGSRDGGALLLVAGEVVAELEGLDNPYMERPMKWSFGAVENQGFGGSIQLDDMIGDSAQTIPRIGPVFADNFGSPAPVWSGGECGEHALPTADKGQLKVPIDPAAVDCFASRLLDLPQRQLKARVRFDPSKAVIDDGDMISLLRGWSTSLGFSPLEVSIGRSLGGALEIQASSVLASGQPVSLGWKEIPESGETELEIHWWAATSALTADGGLRLSLVGQEPEEDLQLSNYGVDLVELALGAMGVGAGNGGELVFDVVEAWR